MVSERWNTVRWGSNTALNPAIGRFVEAFDSPLDSTLNAFDTSIESFNQTINPSIYRIVKAFNSTLFVITQS